MVKARLRLAFDSKEIRPETLVPRDQTRNVGPRQLHEGIGDTLVLVCCVPRDPCSAIDIDHLGEIGGIGCHTPIFLMTGDVSGFFVSVARRCFIRLVPSLS